MFTGQQGKEDVERQGFNVSEAARIIGVGRTSLHKMINQGRVRVVKFGARTVVPKREIDRLLNGTDDNDAA